METFQTSRQLVAEEQQPIILGQNIRKVRWTREGEYFLTEISGDVSYLCDLMAGQTWWTPEKGVMQVSSDLSLPALTSLKRIMGILMLRGRECYQVKHSTHIPINVTRE